jgi:transposase
MHKYIILQYECLLILIPSRLIVQELTALCEDANVKLEYLPPYSPDFNPIEEAFAELKAWIRRNNALVEAYESFDGFLNAALNSMTQRPGNHFRSAHIMM